jgi:putative acetyltransferase
VHEHRDDVVIDRFRSEDQPAFAALNRAWLVQYGLLEEPDEVHLRNPLEHIIAPGGEIFVARHAGEVVGTSAVTPHGEGVMELVKLAVSPSMQGRGLGRRLVDACVAFARDRGVRRVVLVSNSQLGAALRIYEAVGFRHEPLPPDVPYATADVYMELDLAPTRT